MSNDGKTMSSIFVEDEELIRKDAETVDKEEIVLPKENVNFVDLPSNGLLGYPRTVEYRDLLVADEEVLASATAATYSRTLNSVLKRVLNNCEFYEKMSLADRDWALVWVWANNYSATKKVEIGCDSCKHRFTETINLTELKNTPIKENIGKNFPKQFPLSKTGGNVVINMITVADEMFVEEFLSTNPETRMEHALAIRSIDLGIPLPFEKKLEWVENNVTAKEMAKIRQLHAHFAYGIDSVVDYKCPACGEVTRDSVPFQTEDILYPVVSDDIGELIHD